MGLMSIAPILPDNKTFDLLDKLVAEYDVAIGIHNHGPGHRYDKASDVEKVIKDRHPKIGACVDTGHYLRSDENPVEILERFNSASSASTSRTSARSATPPSRRRRPRDCRRAASISSGREGKLFTVLGEGELDVKGCLKVLRAQDYRVRRRDRVRRERREPDRRRRAVPQDRPGLLLRRSPWFRPIHEQGRSR